MDPERTTTRLRDMLRSAQKVQDFTAGLSRFAFDEDERTQYAVIALLEIIGEAASQIPLDERGCYPHIPWRMLIGMRNHLIHGYHAVDLDILWTTIAHDIPHLIQILDDMLPRNPSDSSPP